MQLKITPEEIENRNKKLLTDDKNNGQGFLSLILIFIYKFGPLAVTDLTLKMQDYLKRELDRVTIFRQADRLVRLGIVCKIASGEVMVMDENEKEIIHRHIEALHRKFLTTISTPFRNTYSNRNYLWLGEEGKKYLEWACKLNKFGYKNEK